ncbi:MAG: threonine ammonia-lyase, partial [Vicinamibacterales bacterium]
LVTLDEIREAAERIRGVARVTPLMDVSHLVGAPLFLKCENLQPAGAFKIRGAYNMVAQLGEEARRRGVITYSSGNHGQAMALAARALGAPAVVVMPTTAPAVKADGARAFGAEVIFEGTTSAERKARAEREAAARGLTMVPPFDHRWIIAGQGTAGLEILDQAPAPVATVVVQMGGGGLVSGVAAGVKRLSPATRVIGVEPAGAAKMTASRAAGRPVSLDRTASVADGLMPVRPGDLTFAHVQTFVDDLVTVDDSEIVEATLWLFDRAKLVVEPSGAAALAAVRSGKVAVSGTTVVILSGGNVSLEKIAELAQVRSTKLEG